MIFIRIYTLTSLNAHLHAPMIIQDRSEYTVHYTFAHTIHFIYILIEHCHFAHVSPALKRHCPSLLHLRYSIIPSPSAKSTAAPQLSGTSTHLTLPRSGTLTSLHEQPSLLTDSSSELYSHFKTLNPFVSEPLCSEPEHVSNKYAQFMYR